MIWHFRVQKQETLKAVISMLHIKIGFFLSEAYCRQCRAAKEKLRIRVLLFILLFCSDFSYQMDLQLASSDSPVAHNMCEQA